MTSDLGACIAAGGTVHLMRSHREHHREIARLHEMVQALHVRIRARGT